MIEDLGIPIFIPGYGKEFITRSTAFLMLNRLFSRFIETFLTKQH